MLESLQPDDDYHVDKLCAMGYSLYDAAHIIFQAKIPRHEIVVDRLHLHWREAEQHILHLQLDRYRRERQASGEAPFPSQQPQQLQLVVEETRAPLWVPYSRPPLQKASSWSNAHFTARDSLSRTSHY